MLEKKVKTLNKEITETQKGNKRITTLFEHLQVQSYNPISPEVDFFLVIITTWMMCDDHFLSILIIQPYHEPYISNYTFLCA